EVGLDVSFTGAGAEEKGFLSGIDEKIFTEKVGKAYLEGLRKRLKDGNPEFVSVDPMYFRPTEVELLIGDATKARTKLNWTPKYDLAGLVADMMQSDIHLMQKDAYLKDGGYRTLNYFE
ncbi:MAG: GDP-mannose 4,6-dehydratase, partial [Mangrovibacterium sp.]